jgi:UDP-3-O-[3-hydroxymyristoyl] glucosamine N-acyltransferase
MTLTIETLSKLCQAKISHGDPHTEITSAADIMEAKAHQVTVLSNPKYIKYLKNSQAAACFVADNFSSSDIPNNLILLTCADPEISFLNAITALYPSQETTHHIAKQSVIADNVQLGHNIHIGAFTSIEAQSEIGDNSKIFAHVQIGIAVKIGKNCRIHPQVVIYDHTEIGDGVIVHSGTVIGADGFGYKYRDHQHIKVPHVGNVIIEDQVEIGANTCIDRGALGSTVIGTGSKIDNLVQLGHNNKIGRHVIICGQSGISGSCTIEDGAILAGSVGIADHVTIGEQAVVMARSGVSQDVKAKTQVFGFPAKERKTAWKELAALTKLPPILKKFKLLEARIKQLEQSIHLTH